MVLLPSEVTRVTTSGWRLERMTLGTAYDLATSAGSVMQSTSTEPTRTLSRGAASDASVGWIIRPSCTTSKEPRSNARALVVASSPLLA